MWVFTQHGFISVVESRIDPTVVMARSRDRKSLEHFLEVTELDPTDHPVVESAGTDYPYRVICKREDVAAFLSSSAMAIDYPSFKTQVGYNRGYLWHDVLMSIWGKVHGLSDRRPRWNSYGSLSYRCEGLTTKNRECRAYARIGKRTCPQHDDQEAFLSSRGSSDAESLPR